MYIVSRERKRWVFRLLHGKDDAYIQEKKKKKKKGWEEKKNRYMTLLYPSVAN